MKLFKVTDRETGKDVTHNHLVNSLGNLMLVVVKNGKWEVKEQTNKDVFFEWIGAKGVLLGDGDTPTTTTRVNPLTSDKIEQLLIRQNEHISTIKTIMQFYMAVTVIGALVVLLMS